MEKNSPNPDFKDAKVSMGIGKILFDPENLKKSRQKNSWNKINIFKKYFPWKWSKKICEIAFLATFEKLQKMDFGQKKISWN